MVSPWEGVISFCAVFPRLPNPQKFGNLRLWAVLSRAQKFYGHINDVLRAITAGTQEC